MDQEFAMNLPNDQQPSAPSLVNMDVVVGYDNMNGKDLQMVNVSECSFV